MLLWLSGVKSVIMTVTWFSWRDASLSFKIGVVNERMFSKEESQRKAGLEGTLRDYLSVPLAPREGIST